MIVESSGGYGGEYQTQLSRIGITFLLIESLPRFDDRICLSSAVLIVAFFDLYPITHAIAGVQDDPRAGL